MNTDELIKKDILDLNGLIDHIVYGQHPYSKSTIELRNRILTVHQVIESQLQYLLLVNLFLSKDTRKIALGIMNLIPILDEMEFYPLVKGCQKIGLLIGKEAETILKVNNHRKYFAHPNNYEKKIKEYDNLANYHSALVELYQALKIIVKVSKRLDKSIPIIKKEIKEAQEERK